MMSTCAIIVVEDEEELRDRICDLLERAGHSVASAGNGFEASQAIAQNRFDVLVADMLMPEMDGLELIAEIKAKYPGLKIVAISGGGLIGSDEYLTMAKGFGAHVLLRKPFKYQALLEAVEQARAAPA